jgi:hypothetical protein
MPRLPAELRESQRLIVERIKATNPASPVSNERIAEVAGCSSTMVSKWISPGKDAREIKWDVVRAAWADGKVDARERALIREATAAVIDQADVVGAVGEA